MVAERGGGWEGWLTFMLVIRLGLDKNYFSGVHVIGSMGGCVQGACRHSAGDNICGK